MTTCTKCGKKLGMLDIYILRGSGRVCGHCVLAFDIPVQDKEQENRAELTLVKRSAA